MKVEGEGEGEGERGNGTVRCCRNVVEGVVEVQELLKGKIGFDCTLLLLLAKELERFADGKEEEGVRR